MARLNTERQKELEPKRIEYAVKEIEKLGYEITYRDDLKINFKFDGAVITYFPYSGWASGKTIKYGRGLNNLLKQIKR